MNSLSVVVAWCFPSAVSTYLPSSLESALGYFSLHLSWSKFDLRGIFTFEMISANSYLFILGF